MSQELIDSEVNNSICEAVGCIAKATTEITVKVGQQGSVKLLVCEICKTKFMD